MLTGMTAWKLAKGLYIVPLLMAYTPLIGGDSETLLRLSFFAIFGMYALVGAMEGYLEDKLSLLTRLIALVASIDDVMARFGPLDSIYRSRYFLGAVCDGE